MGVAATIETTRKTGLLDFPTELLCLIVELVEKDVSNMRNTYKDIQNLRLTCRQLRDAAYKSFAIRFFRKRSHVISAFSINTLHDIISDPHFGPHVKELTLVVRRSRYTGYDRAFGLRKRGEENDMHASDKNFVDSGLYGQLMEKVFAVAHSHGNNLIIMVKKLSGTAQGWFDHGSQTRYSESYALARTLEAARRAGVPPPEFHVETGLINMKDTIMNHLSSQEDHCFSFSFYFSENTKIMYYHRRNTLKLVNDAVLDGHHRFGERIAQVVHALLVQMAITRVEVSGFWLEDGDEFATHVLRPLLPLLESVELCSMYRVPARTLSSIMNFLAEAPKLTRFVFSLDPICRCNYPGGARESLEYEGTDLSSMLKDGAVCLVAKFISWD
ncbi:hypothetical protein D6C91_00829 [Aureobasidium pullulans]|uniref:F-box domain-containing protein n=1 Tax=Aureobasidium pullulans TaxID=5580 RepID=A0A4S9U0I5_AURPU|nr:hypothetical protein D6C91_00829 [Aureobasidium pullulans]